MNTMTGSAVGFTIYPEELQLNDIVAIACLHRAVSLSTDSDFRQRIRKGRETLERKLNDGEVIYGVNTGFGGNVRFVIPDGELAHHQRNLIEYHCCGAGDPLPEEVVRAAILLRANALARGLSAVREVVIERLLDLLNCGITPVVPRFGSVGASGDLSPSAYIARAMCGGGEVFYRGARVPAAEALQREHIPLLRPEAKEGLALLNGTTVMTGVAALVVDEAAYLFRLTLGALAMTAEALGASPDYFHPAIHLAKHHPGQFRVAEMLNSLLLGSSLTRPLEEIRQGVKEAGRRAHELHDVVPASEAIQSPYSIRCAPQGLGPMLESLEQVTTVVEREANSVNDNPLIDPSTDRVYHTGNFFGAHIARAMDGLKLDLANLANWQHSLLALLMDERFSGGLPPSLSPHPGLYQGFKGVQITHTSLVTAIRHWSAPSLIHTLPTEQFNQDIVSLGTHSAMTAMDMIELLRSATAIALLAGAQAVDLRSGDVRNGDLQNGAGRMGAGTRSIYRALRGASAFVDQDRALDTDIREVCGLMKGREIPALR